MFRWVTGLLVVLLSCLPVAAQQVVLPEQFTTTADETRVYRVLVIGDALAGGLGSGLSRILENDIQYDVAFRVNESSGIARPELYDWASAIPSIVEGKNYDAAVLLMGTNDRRDILLNDQTFPFQSEPWSKAYRINTDKLLDVLKANGLQVYWAGLPPMGDPQYDKDMKFVTAIHKERTEAKGEVFVDLYQPLIGADGAYTDRGADDTGEVRRLRSRDGVTFYKQGNNRLGQIVLGAIKVRQADAVFEHTTAATADTPLYPETPLFGQEGDNGEAVVFESGMVAAAIKKGNEEKVASQDVAGPALLPEQPSRPRIAPEGSAADSLFTLGRAGAAAPGRFDDFSFSAPAN